VQLLLKDETKDVGIKESKGEEGWHSPAFFFCGERRGATQTAASANRSPLLARSATAPPIWVTGITSAQIDALLEFH
jgi:hypothetical protein